MPATRFPGASVSGDRAWPTMEGTRPTAEGARAAVWAPIGTRSAKAIAEGAGEPTVGPAVSTAPWTGPVPGAAAAADVDRVRVGATADVDRVRVRAGIVPRVGGAVVPVGCRMASRVDGSVRKDMAVAWRDADSGAGHDMAAASGGRADHQDE